jgi:hypothetical protein
LLASLEINRSLLSTLLIVFFILVAGVSTVISEIFQAPNQENLEISKYRKLLNADDLTNLKSLVIKNNMGEFVFENDLSRSGRSWRITSPRKLLANGTIINSIVDSLSKLKIRYVYQKDKINLSNFSLNNPLFEVSIENAAGSKTNISFGLINPIDRSTYAMLSTNTAIYHIDSTSIPLNSLNLTDLIDTRVFPHENKSVTSVDIFKGTTQNYHQLALTKKENNWFGKNDKELDTPKVVDYLKHLFELRSQLILDRMTPEQLEKVQTYLKKPQYTIKVSNRNNESYLYSVSQPIPDIPEMKLKKWQYVVVSTPDFHHAYILNKNFLKKLNVTENRLKYLDIKKLFY